LNLNYISKVLANSGILFAQLRNATCENFLPKTVMEIESPHFSNVN